MGKSTSKIAKVKREQRKEFREHAKSLAAPKTKTITKEKQQSKRSRWKKLKAYDLSTLSESLPELKALSKSEPLPFKVCSKTKNKLLLKEVEHLKMVLKNSLFQSDPLGAIYQHLQNTQPVAEEKPKQKDNKNGKKKAKMKKLKGQLSQQSMEF